MENATGRDTARNVEILVTKIEHHPIYAVRQPPTQATAIELINRSLAWPDGSLRIDIPPGLTRTIEVAGIEGWLGSPDTPPVARVYLPDAERNMELSVGDAERGEFPMAYFDDELRNAPARIHFALIADNVNASSWTLEISWPWDMPWSAMVGRGQQVVRLRKGTAGPSRNPHLVAGGPWGGTAKRHRTGHPVADPEPDLPSDDSRSGYWRARGARVAIALIVLVAAGVVAYFLWWR